MKKILLFTLLFGGLFINRNSAQSVLKSDFETWTGIQAVSGWDGSKTNITTTAGDSAKKDSASAYHGMYDVKLVNTSTSSKRFSTQPLSITAGTIYNIRFYARGTGSLRTGLYGGKMGTGFGYQYGAYIALASSTWQMYTQTLVADSTNAAAQFLFSVKSTVAPGHVCIDSVSITAAGTVTNQTLYAIQYTLATPANSPFMGQFVTTGGIVTGVYMSGTPSSQSGYYVQTTHSSAWSGLNVYDYNHPVTVGDSVTFTGLVEEYYTETEMAQVNNFTKHSSGNALPAPAVIGFDKIQNEKYEGILVKVKDGNAAVYTASTMEYAFSDSTSTKDTVDHQMFTYKFTVGKRYNVTGIVHFNYMNLLEPRSISDIDSINVTSGILEHTSALGELNIYPNPSDGTFAVTFYATGQENSMNVSVTDLCGRVVYRELKNAAPGKNTWTVQTQGLDKGIYLLELSNTDSSTVRKVIIH
ncbi:MAG: T9SS type A sorting domain-containing protein [Bacteroidia bacterium]